MIGRKVAAVLLGIVTGLAIGTVWVLISLGPCRTPILHDLFCESGPFGPSATLGIEHVLGYPIGIGIGIAGWWEVLVKNRR